MTNCEPYYSDDLVTLLHGDCVEVMRELPDASVDAVVTDPPYELGFMGKGWDASGIAYNPEVWANALRILKPGGHLLAFGGTRTWHRLAVAIEDAGFEVRDSIAWMYGSGFPKSHNLQDDWQGWGTALKPAFEPIVVARKPLIGTVAENVLAHGTGALNIDGARIGTTVETWPTTRAVPAVGAHIEYGSSERSTKTAFTGDAPSGRWPANVILDESQAAELDRQSGSFGGQFGMRQTSGKVTFTVGEEINAKKFDHGTADFGGASRFFYVPKAGSSERPRAGEVAHPTVKPLDLMRYLVKLVTPPGGTVLEPFAGSGTTLEACLIEGFQVIGIELTEDYLPLITQRITKPIEQVLL